MPSAPTTRAARRRRVARRRRAAAGVIAVVIVAALTVGVFGFVRSLSERPASTAGAADVSAALDAADASAEPSPTATAAAPDVDTAAAADAALAVLGDYSDASRATEDALYAATETLRAATTADEADAAQAQVDAASAAVMADAEAFRAEISAAATGDQPTGGDVAAQLAYLHQYVTDYNSDQWGDYNAYGGDCTNFASQGLIARGWHIDGTWYSQGAMWTASKPWIATAPMAAYFDSLGFSYSTETDLDRVRVGDIGIFNWGETGSGVDHTMTVSKVEYNPDGPPTVYFVSHNYDGDFRELTNALYVEHSDSTVRIYHIP